MAYDEQLAARVRDQLADVHGITEKAMFGGIAFLLEGNMAVGSEVGGARARLRRLPAAQGQTRRLTNRSC